MSKGDIVGIFHVDIVPAAPLHRPVGRGNFSQRVCKSKDKDSQTK